MKHNQQQKQPNRIGWGDKKVTMTRGMAVLLTVAVVIVAFIAGTRSDELQAGLQSFAGYSADTRQLDDKQLQRVYKELKANYDGELDSDELIEGASAGMTRAIGDEYTEYLSGAEAEEFQDSLSGKVGGGVGVEISIRNDQPTVVRALPDNPAEKAGLKRGDVIIAINKESVKDQSVDVVASKIRGEVGTSVVLTVLRDEKPKEFKLERADVNNPSVTSTTKDNVGIITLYRFDSETGALAKKAAQKLQDKGVKGIVLDLRNNGGGYLDAAVEVSGLWLKNEVIVSEKAGGKTVETLRSGRSPILNKTPTVVLVNEFSASASEIVAGALKDHKQATIVGETTYGKGTVQRVIDMPHGSILRVTVAHWYTPNGHGIDKKGVKPHRTSKLSSEDINKDRDPQLKAAISEVLKK